MAGVAWLAFSERISLSQRAESSDSESEELALYDSDSSDSGSDQADAMEDNEGDI